MYCLLASVTCGRFVEQKFKPSCSFRFKFGQNRDIHCCTFCSFFSVLLKFDLSLSSITLANLNCRNSESGCTCLGHIGGRDRIGPVCIPLSEVAKSRTANVTVVAFLKTFLQKNTLHPTNQLMELNIKERHLICSCKLYKAEGTTPLSITTLSLC